MKQGFVYILQSLVDSRTYVGSTDDLERRVAEHNRGESKSTQNRRPLKLIYFERFESLELARTREHFLKTTSGRREMRKILSTIIAG